MPTTSARAQSDSDPATAFEIQRLDWLKAAIIGLTAEEVTILKYIADIDGHTADCMREVLETQVPAPSASMTFLRLWNQEEFANCQDMATLLAACGVHLALERKKSQPPRSRLKHWLGRGLRQALGRLVPKSARALQLTWATSQKLMLTLAYERLAHTTQNPILRVLSHRIAKQERRNFFWYFGGARAALRKAPASQALVRLLLENLWFPLSASTRSRQRAQELSLSLWAGASLVEAMTRLDETMAQLPGFQATTFAERFSAPSSRSLAQLTAVSA
jgi:hypothetical protein